MFSKILPGIILGLVFIILILTGTILYKQKT
jgi:hypothetical protein